MKNYAQNILGKKLKYKKIANIKNKKLHQTFDKSSSYFLC